MKKGDFFHVSTLLPALCNSAMMGTLDLAGMAALRSRKTRTAYGTGSYGRVLSISVRRGEKGARIGTS